MSDMLTHWAVFEDCRRLAQFADHLEPFFGKAMEAQQRYARFGAVIRGEGYWSTTMIETARDNWHKRQDCSMRGKRRRLRSRMVTALECGLLAGCC